MGSQDKTTLPPPHPPHILDTRIRTKPERAWIFSQGDSLCPIQAAVTLSLPSTSRALGGEPLPGAGRPQQSHPTAISGRGPCPSAAFQEQICPNGWACGMQSPPRSQTQGAFSRPGPRGEAFQGLEVTRFLLFMAKAFAKQRKHSCQPEAQHNTCGGGGTERGWGAARLPGALSLPPQCSHTGIQGPAS